MLFLRALLKKNIWKKRDTYELWRLENILFQLLLLFFNTASGAFLIRSSLSDDKIVLEILATVLSTIHPPPTPEAAQFS